MSSWKKVVAKTYEERIIKKTKPSILEYRSNDWINDGIFGDAYPDDHAVVGLVNRADDRLREPQWLNASFAAPCEAGCPTGIPSQQRFNLLREGKYEEAYKLILEYTPFPGSVCASVCPSPCMDACSRCMIDTAAYIGPLGRMSAHIDVPVNVNDTGKKIAVVGAGVGGLSTAWILRLRGHNVTVYDRDSMIGGKIFHSVSRERLDISVLESELERVQKSGITFELNAEVDKKKLESLKKEYDAVVLAIGAYTPKLPPWPGKEMMYPYLDFLKKVNAGEKPDIGKKVVVIGCGNSGMDVVFGAYACGAEDVTAIDIQKPAAFEEEIDHAKKLGAKLLWPKFTKEITKKGVVINDGTLLEADTVLAAIGDAPELESIVPGMGTDRGYLKVGSDWKIGENLYAIGDMTRLGILTAAIGAGREAALCIHEELSGRKYVSRPRVRIPKEKLSLGYFSATDSTDFEEAPEKDFVRCISCGTCRDCNMCLVSCPEKAITRVIDDKLKSFEYVSDPDMCIGCGICEGVCPCGIWTMS
jgi:NADPH-dependent glutamate synthase beta subunit-like oxidoreductase/Pyruvate/2-oxoacid:ferredoxin oxidoreductase delta subunit